MFKLRIGYLISGIITGSLLVVSLVASFPDGKLHITFCDVGQGDAAYIRFPDGRDMIVDGGPDEKILSCISRHMPFWDRHINMVLLSHPQKDHLQGLIEIFARYRVDYFLKSDIGSSTEGYVDLMRAVETKKIPIKLVTRGQRVTIGHASLSIIWPSRAQIALMKPYAGGGAVLGAADGQLNDGSVVFALRYGSFDALFPGDADAHVEGQFDTSPLADGTLELLKVPHHGSKTGMTQDYVAWAHPSIAVVSVGKNSYGHPSPEAMAMLQKIGTEIHRTDKEGDIEIVSDGRDWTIQTTK